MKPLPGPDTSRGTDPPLHLEPTEALAFQWRMTRGMLIAISALGVVVTGLTTSDALGWTQLGTADSFAYPSLGPAIVGATTLAFTVLVEFHRRGAEWPLRAITLVLVPMLVAGARGASFHASVPQVVWIPTLLAYALTTQRWSLFIAAVSVGTAVLTQPEVRRLESPVPLIVSVLIVAILATSRAIHDKLHGDARAHVAHVARLAATDDLTDLPNRRALGARLETLLEQARRRGEGVAVLFVGLDGFTAVNETLGHAKGDRVLIEAGARLRACADDGDFVARFGGDEFVVLLTGLRDRARIDEMAARILASLARPYLFGEEQAFLSGSIGAAQSPTDGALATDLLRAADQALAAAKESGRNRFTHFNARLQEDAEQRTRLAHDLRAALANGEITVHYQPIVELATGAIHKAEALARWKHPTRGWISPAIFIPIAESTGLIHDLGDQIFREAVEQVARWRAAHSPRFQISVNRSPAQFRVGGGDRIFWPRHLEERGLAGDSIVLEITEGLLLDDTRGVLEHLEALRDAGIGVSLDDFGTGYSALAYLHKYPIDYVKIDQSFVRALAPASKHLALCKAIVHMAHELGMKVVAEGVETPEQRALLHAAGCDYAQGYLYARPLPAADLEPLLASPPSHAVAS